MSDKNVELLGNVMPNAITVYVEPFMFTQHVFLLSIPMNDKGMIGAPELRDIEVNMSQLPEFLTRYNLPEIHFQGDVITAKKIVHECEEIQKTNNTFGSTRYLFDDFNNSNKDILVRS